MNSPIYYKIMLGNDEKFVVVTLQHFDEPDYNQDMFIKDENGFQLLFNTESKAIEWVNNNIKPKYIDEEFRRPSVNNNKYFTGKM